MKKTIITTSQGLEVTKENTLNKKFIQRKEQIENLEISRQRIDLEIRAFKVKVDLLLDEQRQEFNDTKLIWISNHLQLVIDDINTRVQALQMFIKWQYIKNVMENYVPWNLTLSQKTEEELEAEYILVQWNKTKH